MNLKVVFLTALFNLLVLGMIFLWTYNSDIYLAELAAIMYVVIGVPLGSFLSGVFLIAGGFKKEGITFFKLTVIAITAIACFMMFT